ncbi:MAG: lipoprotein [Paracoccaceae bacterium]|nr:lipoprotein [Paracoccaceae bacterium]
MTILRSALIAACGAVLLLSACGIKGDPKRLESEDKQQQQSSG